MAVMAKCLGRGGAPRFGQCKTRKLPPHNHFLMGFLWGGGNKKNLIKGAQKEQNPIIVGQEKLRVLRLKRKIIPILKGKKKFK